MPEHTIATMFGGGGGVELGATQAGFKPLWTIEYDPEIALWHQLNFPDSQVICNDVSKVDYARLRQPYWLHASPQCKRASVANQGGETKEDITQSLAVCTAIEILRPPVFTLENVYPYRNFEAFTNILQHLHRYRYDFDYWHLNAADYGIPQTRKRLFLVARRDGKPIIRPEATHTKSPQAGLFGSLKPWVGWYEAIEDLIPDLPESEFADWQLARMPKELKTFLLGAGTRSNIKDKNSPSDTITSNSNQTCVKAFMVDGQNSKPPITIRNSNSPSLTITNQYKSFARAFIVSDFDGTCRQKGEPHFTVRANDTGGAMNRAYFEMGRVVKMTPRALARFQSFPDSYQLPDRVSLACTIIGNAVPPKLVLAIAKELY